MHDVQAIASLQDLAYRHAIVSCRTLFLALIFLPVLCDVRPICMVLKLICLQLVPARPVLQHQRSGTLSLLPFVHPKPICLCLLVAARRYVSARYYVDISRLCSSTSSQLMVRPSRLVTVGEWSFTSAGPRLWKSYPDNITAASSLSDFRRTLKSHLFRQSHPGLLSGSFFSRGP